MVSRVGVVSDDFRKQVLGYGLTTAQILYRMPDHPSLLQTYVWQNYDLFPKFPALQDFLAFWQEKLDGALYSVTVAHSRLIKPAELPYLNGRTHRPRERLPLSPETAQGGAHFADRPTMSGNAANRSPGQPLVDGATQSWRNSTRRW